METKLACILLIDDDEATNFLNQMVIEQSGCAEEVKTVQSGAAALAYLSCIDGKNSGFPRPDLIFLDINMPAMNGWEFLEQYEQLREEQKARIMIVMLTTSLFPEDREKALAIPEVSGFENKPLTEEKLEKILQRNYPHLVKG